MAGNIYLIQNNGKLHAMTERPYKTEDLLQKLLEDYPELLVGDRCGRSASPTFSQPRVWCSE